MIFNIKQEELDGAYLDGAIATETAVSKAIWQCFREGRTSRNEILDAVLRASYLCSLNDLGEQRIHAAQNPWLFIGSAS